jgi:hypothetical protein
MAARAAMIVDNLDLTLRRLLAVRAAQPGRFLDVAMDRFVADPLATVRTIYDRFGLMMTGESEEALTGWIGANGRHGGGAATGGELPFGLNRDTLRERFAYYRR